MSKKVMVFFQNQNLKIYVDKGTTLKDACDQAGLYLDYVCGGYGTCGKCRTEVIKHGKRELVLVCQEKIESEITVILTEKSDEKRTNILTSGQLYNIKLNPAIKKIYVKEQLLPFAGSAWESIADNLGTTVKIPSLFVLKKLSMLLINKKIIDHTLVFWRDQIIDIESGDTASKMYGFAIDIGTTTVVGYLYDLYTGECMKVYSALNGQVGVGGDVITRIATAIGDEASLMKLQNMIIKTVNEIISDALQEHCINPQFIYTIVLCGNSAMQHLFLGLSPNNLGRAPFCSVIKGEVILDAMDLNLNINPNGIVNFLPLIGGFVGADTVAVIISVLNDDTDNKIRLMIDIGTNGEIVLGNRTKMLVASTAAGPALEGAGIKCGMRGIKGAIEKVDLYNGKVEIEVIGNEKPIGLCGSGLVDTIAEMLKIGIIDDRGRLLTRVEYLRKCKPEYKRFAENIERIDDSNVFVLVQADESQNADKIYITQKDVRALQLAKGAIYTGCMLLLREYNIEGEQLDEIVIAGAFGNYIDIEKGQYIGLLPSFAKVPIRPIGNAAGTGIQQFLLSKEVQNKTLPILKNVYHIELASNYNFSEEYFKNINFPIH